MRIEVDLPEGVYRKASDIADADNRTLESVVREAVASYIKNAAPDEEFITLTPEQLDRVRRSQEEHRAGKSLSSEELRAKHEQFRRNWIEENAV